MAQSHSSLVIQGKITSFLFLDFLDFGVKKSYCRGLRHRQHFIQIDIYYQYQILNQHLFFTYSNKRGKRKLDLSRMKERRTLANSALYPLIESGLYPFIQYQVTDTSEDSPKMILDQPFSMDSNKHGDGKARIATLSEALSLFNRWSRVNTKHCAFLFADERER